MPRHAEALTPEQFLRLVPNSAEASIRERWRLPPLPDTYKITKSNDIIAAVSRGESTRVRAVLSGLTTHQQLRFSFLRDRVGSTSDLRLSTPGYARYALLQGLTMEFSIAEYNPRRLSGVLDRIYGVEKPFDPKDNREGVVRGRVVSLEQMGRTHPEINEFTLRTGRRDEDILRVSNGSRSPLHLGIGEFVAAHVIPYDAKRATRIGEVYRLEGAVPLVQ